MTKKDDKDCGQVSCQESPPKVDKLPPWKVILHNDDINTPDDVVKAVRKLTDLSEEDAVKRVTEAHKNDLALLLTTHQERAELYVDQFHSCKITVTAEEA